MSVMTAVGWIGVMFLLGALIRAKVKVIGNTMIPACRSAVSLAAS